MIVIKLNLKLKYSPINVLVFTRRDLIGSEPICFTLRCLYIGSRMYETSLEFSIVETDTSKCH